MTPSPASRVVHVTTKKLPMSRLKGQAVGLKITNRLDEANHGCDLLEGGKRPIAEWNNFVLQMRARSGRPRESFDVGRVRRLVG